VEGERKEDRQRDEDVRLALPLAVHSLNRSGDKLGEREREEEEGEMHHILWNHRGSS
jgi:hypothetical protein